MSVKISTTSHSEISLWVLQDRVPGEPFARKPSKDAEMEKILRSMEVDTLPLASFLLHPSGFKMLKNTYCG
jgi:hypothetical protein